MIEKNEKFFAGLEVVNRVPAVYDADSSEPFPADMTGATIVRIGTPKEPHLIEGGGLVIDYQPLRSQEVKRIVLTLSELGGWVVYQGRASSAPSQDAPR